MVVRFASSPYLRPQWARDGQGLLLSRTMLSNHGLPYVGRFACDWHRLATTDPHAAHGSVYARSVRRLSDASSDQHALDQVVDDLVDLSRPLAGCDEPPGSLDGLGAHRPGGHLRAHRRWPKDRFHAQVHD